MARQAQIAVDIANIDHDTFSLQLQVNHLMNTMRALKEARSQKEEDANFCKYMISAIRRVPLEILVKIFEYTSPYPIPGRTSESPLGLSHVCSAWRNAALSCSSFWNRLSIRARHFGNPHHRVIDSLMKTWLGRSNGRPLTLSLTMSKEDGDPACLKELNSSFISISPRLSGLCITSSDFEHLAPFFTLPGGSLPMLETLRLDQYLEDQDSTEQITVFNDAPRLHEVILIITPILVQPSAVLLPWSQLTHLEVKEISSCAFADIIFQSTELRHASFYIMGEVSNIMFNIPVLPSEPVSFPFLEELKLQVYYGSRTIRAVLSMIHLPVLQKLEVAGSLYNYRGEFPLSCLLPGMTGTSMRSLTLFHVELDDLLALLTACSSVETLSLCVRAESAPSIIQNLQRGNPRLPKLTSFTMVFVPYSKVEYVGIAEAFGELVFDWVRERRQNQMMNHLKDVALYICDDNDLREPKAAENMLDLIESALPLANRRRLLKEINVETEVVESWYSLLTRFGFHTEFQFNDDE